MIIRLIGRIFLSFLSQEEADEQSNMSHSFHTGMEGQNWRRELFAFSDFRESCGE